MSDYQPTVFIVDDDEAVRDALGLLLRSVGLTAQAYASAQDFLDTFDPARPGCLVLDVRMPGLSGLDLARHLRGREAALPIIFITGHGDVPMAVEAMRSGAIDFLQKPFRNQELLDRIQDAIDQDRAIRRRLEQRQAVSDRLARLTPREHEVLDALLLGKPNKAIARDFGISERTIEIHRSRVMKKMTADSLAALIQMVEQVLPTP